MFMSDYSVKLLTLKCFRPIKTKNLLVTIVVPKLQNLILLVTRRLGRVVPLFYCNVTGVQISPQSPKLILCFILRRIIAPQKLTLLSSAKIVTKIFEAFTLYVNKKTPNMSFLSGQQRLIRTISSTKLMMRILQRSCAHVHIRS